MSIEPPPTTTTDLLPPLNPHKALDHLLNTKHQYSLHNLKQTHAQSIKHGISHDSYIAGSLVKLYANPDLGSFHFALQVFDQVPKPHVFLWNSLIRGYLDNGLSHKAISSYCSMVMQGSRPNKYTFPSLFKACSAAKAPEEGRQLHGHVVKLGLGQDGYVRSSGIQMYTSCGMVIEARWMFDEAVGVKASESWETSEAVHIDIEVDKNKMMDIMLDGRATGLDPVSWNVMIDGYMRCGDSEAARDLFDRMPGRNVGSWNAMISGYVRIGRIEESRRLFDEMPQRDDVSWSAMIDGYVGLGYFKDTLDVFHQMLGEGVSPIRFVLSSVLSACANAGALGQGRWIHEYIDRRRIELDAVLGTSLLDMYAKCGQVDLAFEVFKKIRRKETSSWNAMIGGFAIHGHAKQAIELFSQMKTEEFKCTPDAITFIGLLSAFAHAGLVEEGYECFRLMEKEYGISPTVEHYGCMVDLFGRAGLLEEAEDMIRHMPMKPNAAVWGALLGACRIHGNVELGERVGKLLLEMEPQNSGRYALLSNIYAKAGRWNDVSRVRTLMKNRGVKTVPARSLIESDGVIHEFVMGDT